MRFIIDSVELMLSKNYKDRFLAEYWQLRLRLEKLDEMIRRYWSKTLPFEPTCPIGILEKQRKHMRRYLETLEQRAAIENIELEAPCDEDDEEEENNERREDRHGGDAEDRG